MTGKEIKYQIALGTLDASQLLAVNIRALKDYVLYRKIFKIIILNYDPIMSGKRYVSLSNALLEHAFCNRYFQIKS